MCAHVQRRFRGAFVCLKCFHQILCLPAHVSSTFPLFSGLSFHSSELSLFPLLSLLFVLCCAFVCVRDCVLPTCIVTSWRLSFSVEQRFLSLSCSHRPRSIVPVDWQLLCSPLYHFILFYDPPLPNHPLIPGASLVVFLFLVVAGPPHV